MHAAVGREALVGRQRSRPPTPARVDLEARRRAGSTRSRRGRRGGSSSGLRAMTSRRNAPSTRVASLIVVPGLRHVDRVVAEVGQGEVAQQQAAVRVRVRAHAALAARRERRRAPARARPSLVEELLGPVAPQPLLELAAGARGCRARRRAAPGASATCPRPAGRRPPSGRSSPSACAGRSSASAAARSLRRRARRAGCARSRRARRRAPPRSAWCTAAGSSPRPTSSGR